MESKHNQQKDLLMCLAQIEGSTELKNRIFQQAMLTQTLINHSLKKYKLENFHVNKYSLLDKITAIGLCEIIL